MASNVLPFTLARAAGQARWFAGSRAWIRADGERTGGAFCLIEGLMPPGEAIPWHRHHDEDESFYVLEGQMTILCGEERIAAEPGTFVYAPRGIPHGFRAEGVAPARFLLLATPAGFERFVLDLSEPAQGDGFLPASPPDPERFVAVSARHHIEILGTLPA